jgi:hypothetical protein
MTRTARIVISTCALALIAPAAAPAADGTGGAVAPGSTLARAAGAVTVEARAFTPLGRTARFRGSVRRARKVRVERFDAATGAWVVEARAKVKRRRFIARWLTDVTGEHRVRVVALRRRGASRTSGELAIRVYPGALATWYGPGFYGNTTACGLEMTPELIGVAHRTLPCGTEVTIYYAGSTIVVPVVDRGPYHPEADWDLTSATAQALGFTGTGEIGAQPASR